MLTPGYIPVTRVTALALALFMFDFALAGAQQTAHPWSGIAADDARPVSDTTQWEPFTTELSPRSLTRDGRFVVFTSRAPLVASDTNSDWDIYLRDRQTNELSRVSVSVYGQQPGCGRYQRSARPFHFRSRTADDRPGQPRPRRPAESQRGRSGEH
jgi:hypothetical protein